MDSARFSTGNRAAFSPGNEDCTVIFADIVERTTQEAAWRQEAAQGAPVRTPPVLTPTIVMFGPDPSIHGKGRTEAFQ
ncbi:hypothetical protein [Pelagibius sp.]|uniref:hypothetical protein n=1 Tax=Pelagibius sp. TaxID=1931238 RepID=UPI003B5065EE